MCHEELYRVVLLRLWSRCTFLCVYVIRVASGCVRAVTVLGAFVSRVLAPFLGASGVVYLLRVIPALMR
jgi:hypothetical protein